jgi:acyl carrier protein
VLGVGEVQSTAISTQHPKPKSHLVRFVFSPDVFTEAIMHNSDHIVNEILNLASNQFKVSREELSPDDDFFKKLGIDSLQALELLTRLENHFNVELPDYEVQGVTDFRTLAERIQSRL